MVFDGAEIMTRSLGDFLKKKYRQGFRIITAHPLSSFPRRRESIGEGAGLDSGQKPAGMTGRAQQVVNVFTEITLVPLPM
jgi:hypothetical protein